MLINRFNIDLVKYLSYIFEWDNMDILSDIDYTSEQAKGTIEGYTLALYLMLKKLYISGNLYMDYINPTTAPLPYICGNLDIQKSIQTNSLASGAMWQSYRELGVNIPVNLSIKFCLETLLRDKRLRGTDFCARIYKLLSDIFKEDSEYIFNSEAVLFHLNTVNSCLDSDFYLIYHPVLKICQMILEQLYLSDCDLESVTWTQFFDVDVPYVMQEFLRTALRHAMLRLNSTAPYEDAFKGKWSMRRKDCFLDKSGLNMDILIKFSKSSSFPNLIFDSKTNKFVHNSRSRNRMQLQTYVTEYRIKNPNTYGILQYFVDSEATAFDLSYNNCKFTSEDSSLNMFTWVYQVNPNSEPKEFEDYIYNQLVSLFEL